VVLVNTDPRNPYRISRGDRIAQLVIQPVSHVQWNEVAKLDDNDRGGGFGHSGR
jgi:dUTP pyrophosphatase